MLNDGDRLLQIRKQIVSCSAPKVAANLFVQYSGHAESTVLIMGRCKMGA